MSKSRSIGIIGSGSFGTAIANLIAPNAPVLMYTRNEEVLHKINKEHRHFDLDLPHQIVATTDLEQIARECTLIFPVVPSVAFREVMQKLGPHLKPYHLLVHGTKGFDIYPQKDLYDPQTVLARSDIHTMSQVIEEESSVVRIGCLSGPNLAVEILEGQPTATLVASHFKEVIKSSRRVLDGKRFHVFGGPDLIGAELAGAMKNAIAIGSGILGGLGLGKNIQAMLITRGLVEMVNMGKAMGSSPKAFLGTAGIGDLVATATSTKSRNFTLGTRIAKGESLQEVSGTMPELAEGVRTIRIMNQLATHYKLHAPITMILQKVVFENMNVEKAIDYLMSYPYGVDVDFI